MPDNDARQQRILRQHVKTDQLLGVEQVPPVSSASASDKAAQLEAIDAGEVRACRKCALCESRTHTVFGEGDPNARLLFIGEGPGQNEDQQGRPFVGRAGDLLNKMIVAMGLQREQVFIANIVKCRPPNNRAPLPDEVVACSDYMHRQIDVIEPEVIVTLGGPAAKKILYTKPGISAIRGTWYQFQTASLAGEPIPVMPTFHPAFLLRQYTEDNRQKVWSDLQQVMDKLGLEAKGR